MADGDPTANSTEAQSSVNAALDSVTVINNIVNNTFNELFFINFC